MYPFFESQEYYMLLRVLLAASLGVFIGIERKGQKGAGCRTFSLICMGSCLITVLALEGFPPTSDPSRMVAQIVTGIGFIGAGVIWRSRNDMVHGLTTAAAVWVAAAIGISIGIGYIVLPAVCVLMIMVILAKGHPIQEAKENLNLCEKEPEKCKLENI